MNRRAAIAAVVFVSAIVFVIRVAIVFLKKEAAVPTNPVVVDRSRSSPVSLPPQTKEEANAKLMVLASEARAAKELDAATASYEAQRALAKDDCPRAKAFVARAGASISDGSPTKGAHESAARSVDGYCATMPPRP